MPLVITLLLCIVFLSPASLRADDDLLEIDSRTTTIDFLLENAIRHNLIYGGIILVGDRGGVLYSTARGRIGSNPNAPLIGDRTLFDIASLTKVFATTPAMMKLLEEGRIGLMDPLTRWFPEFEGTGREEITILNLLTHTSGLADYGLSATEPLKSAITRAAFQKNGSLPGNHFRYADINFILLGELVRRASGMTLDGYCRERIYKPLGMQDTLFLPGQERLGTIAPTLAGSGLFNVGVVQDDNARYLGGIAGHAGLFSTAFDLARFARMILSGGALDGQRILSERVVTQMTAPYFYSSGRVVRGLGWDIESPYSSPRGSFFSEASFGHTGYSGSSIWLDPQRNLFVVLLTIRSDYSNKRHFSRLRSNISTLAAAAFRPHETPETALLPELLKP